MHLILRWSNKITQCSLTLQLNCFMILHPYRPSSRDSNNYISGIITNRWLISVVSLWGRNHVKRVHFQHGVSRPQGGNCEWLFFRNLVNVKENADESIASLLLLFWMLHIYISGTFKPINWVFCMLCNINFVDVFMWTLYRMIDLTPYSNKKHCNVYISRPTRCTNSYNVSLLIIKRSTCFGLFSPSSGATFWSCISQLV